MNGMPEVNETMPQEGVDATTAPSASRQAPFAYRLLTCLVQLPLIGLSTGFFGSLSLLCGLWDKEGSQQHSIARVWAGSLLGVALSPVRIEGVERLHVHETAVYASNHLSYYDTPVLFAKLPFQFRILAKASLWKVPFVGWYLNRSGQVPIDQSSARAGVISLGRGVKTLQSGMPLVIFPEGGRSASGQVKEFAAGAAWMAIKAQMPLVPLTIVGTYELLPIHHLILWPRRLKLIVGEPIPTVGLTTKDAEALNEQLRNVIAATYAKHHG